MRNSKSRSSLSWMLCAAVAAVCGATVLAEENIDPAGADEQYAWGENAGWINAEPAGDGGPGAEVGDFQLQGWLWGENIGWISLSCANTSTCAVTSYGVTNDGFGALSGFAWGENAGWLNFGPTACAPDPTCGVRIDPATGFFAGRAWGENVGWVTFSAGAPLLSSARTSWCQSTPAPPGSAATLTLGKAGPALALAWSVLLDASWYDVVRGTLSTLRASGGDFKVATANCVVAKTVATSHTLAEPDPPVGDGHWFLVRGSNCRGHGSYDTGASTQIGARDAEIAASAADCP